MRNATKYIFAMLSAMFLLVACSPRIITVPVRDSTFLAEREHVTFVPVEVPLPKEPAQRETQDTLSHLETSVAESDAVISGGILYHTLTNKPQPVKAEVPQKEKIVTEYREKEVPVPVEVPKPYIPKWVWWVAGWAAVCTGWFAIKLFLRIRGLKI